MVRSAAGREVVPAVQRLRLRYAKRGRLRFSSHRDFQRAFERALRRAGVPMAYSAGFSPHPKVSYANAAPTGAASEAEYVEIGVLERLDPEAVRAALDEALPEGLDVLEVVEARTPDFAVRLEGAIWELVLEGVEPADLSAAVAAFLAQDSVPVPRLTKNGTREVDPREAVLVLEVTSARGAGVTQGPCAILTLVVRHGTPSVRPDDVLAALRRVADLVPPVPPRATRLAQGPLDQDGRSVGDPLSPDRGGADVGV
jgi:radical SAM-linked protein